LEEIAFGELGLKPDEFYMMTPRNFINAQNGHKRLYEQNQQAEWERARWMACVIINPHLKRNISPKKITTFPWEKTRKTKNQAMNDIERLRKESEFDDKVQSKLKLKKKNKNA
tara:strand:+ start:4886 stop:5224 length:339 start_codon:yes stop_codon:yes gene_type:complete